MRSYLEIVENFIKMKASFVREEGSSYEDMPRAVYCNTNACWLLSSINFSLDGTLAYTLHNINYS